MVAQLLAPDQFPPSFDSNLMPTDLLTLNEKLKFVGLKPVQLVQRDPNEMFAGAVTKDTKFFEDEDVVEYFFADAYLGSAVFRKDGTLKSVSPWRDGRPHGTWQDFSSTGQIISQVDYISGEKYGLALRWHDNGELAYASEYNGRNEKSTTASWGVDGVLNSWRIEAPGGESTAFICLACRYATYCEGWDHAGFSERGFLYNDHGDFVISWDAWDPKYVELVGEFTFPWKLNLEQQARIERQLLPAPIGGEFRFSNPARCRSCKQPLLPPLPDCVYMWDTKRMIRSGVGERYPHGPLENYLK